METYWKSPELTFFSGGTGLAGWSDTLKRYQNRYQKEGQEMGRLRFTDLVVVSLAPDAGFIRGRFHLRRTGKGELTGLFTLVVKRFPKGWRIVHDHTSTGN